MREDQLFQGNRLKAADLIDQSTGVRRKVTLTIDRAYSADFGKDGKKRVLAFRETKRELVLNKTNWKLLAKLTGQPDDDNWAGHRVVLYSTMVEYQGDMVDAIRVGPPPDGNWEKWAEQRAASQIQELPTQPAPAPTPAPAPAPAPAAAPAGPLAGDVQKVMEQAQTGSSSGGDPFHGDEGSDGPDDLPF